MPRKVAASVLAVVVGLVPAARTAAGVAADGPVSLSYPTSHWGPGAFASLSGAGPGAEEPLYSAGFWYRAEGDTREYPLPPPDTQTYDGGVIRAYWANLDGKGFELEETTYVADNEGPSGAFWTRLQIENHNANARSFAIFHLVDVDLGVNYLDDGAQLLASPLLYKWKVIKLTDPVDTSAVGRYAGANFDDFQVGDGVVLRSLLNDSVVNDLDNSGLPFGPGDVAAALERRYTLPPEGVAWVFASVGLRLPRAHIKGSFFGLSSYPALFYRLPTYEGLIRGMRHTTLTAEDSAYYTAPGLQAVAIDDFDGDLADEGAARDPLTGETFINGQPIQGAVSPAPNWVFSSSGDWNADGRADILWRNVTSQKLVIWLMNGITKTGNVIPSPDQAVDGNWAVAGSADFNGDGARDILWYNQTSGRIVLWHMNAAAVRIAGGFTTPAAVSDNNWRVVAVGDFGKGPGGVHDTQDIVWQNDTSLRIVVWHMNLAGVRTSGTFTSPDNLGAGAVVIGPR